MLSIEGDLNCDKVLSNGDIGAQVRDVTRQLLAVLEHNLASGIRNSKEFLGNPGARVSKLDLDGLHLAEIMAVDEHLHASSLGDGLALFGLLLHLSESLFLALLDLLSWQVIGVLLDGFLGLPELVSLGLVGDLSAKASGKSDALDLVIVVFKLFGCDPLLIVEGQQDLYGDMLDVLELLLWNLCSVEQPSQRRDNALQTLELPIPLGCHYSLVHLP